MLRLAATSLLTFVLATILHSPAADAVAISTADPYVSQFCADCAPLKDDDLQIYRDQPIGKETTTPDADVDGPTWGETEPAVSYFPQIILNNDRGGTEAFEFGGAVKDWSDDQRTVRCSYFDGELHDPSRVRDECGDVELGADCSELISVLTLTTGLAIFFAVIALAWLGHRSYRNWRLRNVVLQGAATNPRSWPRPSARRH